MEADNLERYRAQIEPIRKIGLIGIFLALFYFAGMAGTGTITASGRVGGIGGIEEKMIGASRIGATVFLAPRENCPDIEHIPVGVG